MFTAIVVSLRYIVSNCMVLIKKQKVFEVVMLGISLEIREAAKDGAPAFYGLQRVSKFSNRKGISSHYYFYLIRRAC